MNLKFKNISLACVALWAGLLHAQTEEPIRLHPGNPHYFFYRGKALALVSSAEHYGAVMNGEFDYHKYLAALNAAWARSSEAGYAGGGNKIDLAKWDAEYFAAARLYE